MTSARHRGPVTPRRRAGRVPVAIAVAAAACGLLAAVAISGPDAAVGKKEQEEERPNVVVVMSDDQHADSMRFMNEVNAELGAGGATFQNSFASFPLCC